MKTLTKDLLSFYQEALKTVLECSSSGILIIDQDRQIVHINHFACEFLGVTKQDMLNRDITDIFPHSELAKVQRTGEIHRDKIAVRNNKKIIISRIPLYQNGSVIGAISLFQDFQSSRESESDIRARVWENGLSAKYSFSDIIHQSALMEETISVARAYAKTASTILITGESGTGKELFAQSIHNDSARREHPFVALNCTTLTENILESELFGYVEGSFTGAKKGGKPGLFQLANHGTLFLDEIGDIPISFQAKFLRALQEQQIRPVGSEKIIPIDVRVMTATNKNLEEEVERGNFRLDLLYRINALKLYIPPLRDRIEDIPDIVLEYFDRKNPGLYPRYQSLIGEVLSALKTYTFPGNIRELENMIDRLCLLLSENLLKPDIDGILDQLIDSRRTVLENRPVNISKSLEEEEKQKIIDLLLQTKGNKKEVARRLKISPSTLWRKMKAYGIQ